MQKLLAPTSYLGHLAITEDDAISILIAIDEASFATTRRISYLKERIENLLQPLEWRHSVLNKAEDRLLRLWYLTRGTNVEMTEPGYKTCYERCIKLFGPSLFDTHCVSRDKVMRFANSCVTVRTLVGKKVVVVKPKVKKIKKEDLFASLGDL